ncbi:MAG TPA: glycosyltransferase family 4 protein [Candidatus Xenobia bacterium]|nr:glycosyltransferase family 4 protein [Candidatus Xenobia bacterium]
MKLLVALPAVFCVDWGIAMFNRALLLALQDVAEASVLSLNDATPQCDPRYAAPPAIRFRGFERRKTSFSLAFLRQALARPDLVILGHVNLLPLATPLWARSIPYWLIAHGDEAWVRLPALSRRALARAQTVLTVSDFTRQRLAAVNGVRGNHWQIFPNTLDPFFEPVGGEPAHGLTLLSVSRLEAAERANKGILHVLEALPELRRRFPKLRYVVVGDGDDRAWLEQRTRELGVAESVVFTGFLSREDLSRQYAACDVFVLPSDQEGFGIVYLEAMAHHKPVVASRAGGAPEVVTDGETGLLIEHGNQAALVTALSTLLASPERRQQLGAAGFARLQQHYTFEHFRARLHGLLAQFSSSSDTKR